MTALIEMPGVLTNTTGLQKIITTNNGFPDGGLADLFLFGESTGTAAANSVTARPSGLVEQLAAGDYAGAYSWLGGGIELQGTYIVSMPEFDPTVAWSLVYAGAVTGSLSGATEAISGMIAFRDRSTGITRGPALYARSFQAGGVTGYYQHRMWDGAVTDGAATNLSPSANLSVANSHRVAILSYNGSDTVTSTLYDKDGAVIATGTISATDAGMTTSNGAVSALVKPAIGISNTVYDGGIQRVEAFARYSRVLATEDITRICARAAAIGAGRGRPW